MLRACSRLLAGPQQPQSAAASAAVDCARCRVVRNRCGHNGLMLRARPAESPPDQLEIASYNQNNGNSGHSNAFALTASAGSSLALSRYGAFAAPPQFPAFFQRADDFVDRHLDADGGAGLAGVSHHGIVAAAGRGGLRGADSDFFIRAAGRIGGGSLESASRGDRHASRFDDSGVYSGGAHAAARHKCLGDRGAGGAAGSGERVRRAGAAIISDRDGGARRFDERDRAEFFDVQWRPGHRPGHRGNFGGAHRRGLVLFRECGELYRGDHRAAADEAGAAAHRAERLVAVRAYRRRIPLRVATPRRCMR